MTSFQDIQPVFEKITRALPLNSELYLVGGAIRDMLLQRPTVDFDFALPSGSIPAARKVADALGGDFYPLDQSRDTGRVILYLPDGGRRVLDFAAFRGPDLESDLRDRDFTVNAIALDVRKPDVLIDPLGGAADLRRKSLRACSPASFLNDPVRILRGVRMAIQFNFKILPDTLNWLRQAVPALSLISAERERDELFKILEGPRPASGLRMLDMLDVIGRLLPELADLKNLQPEHPRFQDAWNHSLDGVGRLSTLLRTLQPEQNPEVAENWILGMLSLRLGRYRRQLHDHLSKSLNPNRSQTGLLMFAVLYHHAGAEAVRQRAVQLRMSNAEIARLDMILHHNLQPEHMAHQGAPPTRRDIYRFFRETGPAGVDICLISLADTLAAYGPELPQTVWIERLDVARALLEAWWEAQTEIISPPQLLNGHDLMEIFRLPAGPEVGKVLELVREAQASGELHSREEALELAGNLVQGYTSSNTG